MAMEAMRRTLSLYPDPKARPYDRLDFLNPLTQQLSIDPKKIVAFGSVGGSQAEWQLTLTDALEVDRVARAGECLVSGYTCPIAHLSNRVGEVRVHWLPYYVDNSAIVSALEENKLKVKSIDMEKSGVTSLGNPCTLVRKVVIEYNNPGDVPHSIDVAGIREPLKALITMKGRLPSCFRCGLSGHVRANCQVPTCRYCKQVGHGIEDCSTRPVRRSAPGSYAAVTASGQTPIERNTRRQDTGDAPNPKPSISGAALNPGEHQAPQVNQRPGQTSHPDSDSGSDVGYGEGFTTVDGRKRRRNRKRNVTGTDTPGDTAPEAQVNAMEVVVEQIPVNPTPEIDTNLVNDPAPAPDPEQTLLKTPDIAPNPASATHLAGPLAEMSLSEDLPQSLTPAQRPDVTTEKPEAPGQPSDSDLSSLPDSQGLVIDMASTPGSPGHT